VTEIRTQGLDHVALSVRDLVASERWYREVLGLERAHADAWDVPVFLVSEGSGLALFSARGDGESSEPAVRILHVAFRVDRAGFEAAQQALREREIPIRLEDHGVSHSLYFRDPDGHRLELTTYEL
jgi:catechol 2,3-dioxygenase-like lactoylglutathione lyase family enzyme